MIVYSPDQTTRIHANGSKENAEQECWHEICRPQVHGYDLLRVAFLSPSRFISIADEKVARVFDAPQEFLEIVKNLHVADIASGLVSASQKSWSHPTHGSEGGTSTCCRCSTTRVVKQSGY